MLDRSQGGRSAARAAVSFAAGDTPFSVAVADLDGDGIPDLVSANIDSDNVSVLLGNGDGSFQAAPPRLKSPNAGAFFHASAT